MVTIWAGECVYELDFTNHFTWNTFIKLSHCIYLEIIKFRKEKLREWIPNNINPKTSMPKPIINKLIKAENREKILKASESKITFLGKNNLSDSGFHIRNWRTEGSGMILLQVLKEKNCQPSPSTQWKYPSGMKGESRHFPMKKA